MFGKKKKITSQQYDSAHYRAVLRCSICTGEQTAGFKEISTGKFHEVMLIRDLGDLEEFKRIYSVEEIIKEY